MSFGNEQSVSFKGNKAIIQCYDNDNCCYRKRKTIKQTSQLKKSIYLKILKEIQISTISNGFLKQSSPQFEVIQQSPQIIIKSPFIQAISLAQALRDTLNLSKLSEKRIYNLFVDLLQRLIDQGNLPYFPTNENIFLDGDTTILNLTSVVGTVFLETRQAVSKAQFKEICPLLHQNAFGSQSLEIDYMSFKQRAILAFILSLVCNRQFCLISPKIIGETVTFQEAKYLLKNHRESIQKYLTNKSVTAAIKRFENMTNLRLFNVIKKVLMNQERLSWPQFISELARLQQGQQINEKLEQHLGYLAQYHWKKLPQYTKIKLYKDGWVSSQSSEKLIETDKDFFLAKMMKTPVLMLLDRVSLAYILEKPNNFDKIGYEIWNNFIKILPQTKLQIPKLKCVLSQSHHYQLIRGQLQANNKQSHSEQKQNQQEEAAGLFLDNGSVDFKFIMRLGQRKLLNNISIHSKQVSIRHEKLKSLDQVNQAFR